MNILTGSFGKAPSDKPKVTREKAVAIAKFLMRHKHVLDVLVFGSIAKNGIGNDVDLVIIADFKHAQKFLTIADIKLPPRVYVNKRMREEIAIEVLGEHFEDFVAEAKDAVGADLDLFVFPPDWRERLDAIRHSLHVKPAFMQNIVWDAVSLITGMR